MKPCFQSTTNSKHIMDSHDSERHRKTCIKFFFCLLIGTLIHIVLLLIIFQAILHVRRPKARISRVIVHDLHFNFSSRPSETMKLVTQVTLHNPTLGNLRFQNGTLAYLYKQNEISLGTIAGMRVKGRSEKKLSVVTLLNSTSLLTQQDISKFSDDFDSGMLLLTARIKLDGEIHLMKVIKRTITLETHCVMVVNLVLQDTQSIKCK